VPAADARGLHPPGGGQVGWAEAHALHSRARRGDLLEVHHALRGLQDGVYQDRAVEARLGLELRQEAIHVVDVPGALDLGHHDHVQLVPDLRDQLGDVIEHPGALQAVHARPERGLAEVGVTGRVDQPSARGLLAIDGHGVLEVAEQDVGLGGDLGGLGGHLLVREVEEVDHPRGREGDLAERLRRLHGERLEEVTWVAHAHGRLPTAARR
jgi:hypothetical protein